MSGNVYDDDEFRARYSALPRSRRGLDGAPEWPTLRSMLPPLNGAHVVDLGCGFGWFCRWAHEHGAATVLGIDSSPKMLERAAADTTSAGVVYRLDDLERLDLPERSFDLAYSSLALHYVTALPSLFDTVHEALAPGGVFVISVEHPIYSAGSGFTTGPDGTASWPISDYLTEGERARTWLVDGVVRFHRTVATYINQLIVTGFRIERVEEWGPTDAQIAASPALEDERHRPAFLQLRASTARRRPAE